jgi:hypothetical protein
VYYLYKTHDRIFFTPASELSKNSSTYEYCHEGNTEVKKTFYVVFKGKEISGDQLRFSWVGGEGSFGERRSSDRPLDFSAAVLRIRDPVPF